MYCLNCGTKIPEGENKCVECGTEVMTMPQPTAESETVVLTEDAEAVNETAEGILSETEAASDDEAGVSPRLYQEPVPMPVPAVEPIPEQIALQYQQQAPAQPQYQQTTPMQQQYQQAPPQYQQPQQNYQIPNQQYQQTPIQMPVPSIQPIITQPFMKRKDFFKSPLAEKIRGKIDLLNILTGMCFGMVMICFFCTLLVLFTVIYTDINSIKFFISETDTSAIFTVSIITLSLLAVFGVLYLIAMKTKHFGLYIPLLVPPLFFTAASTISLIMLIDSVYFTIDFFNAAAYYFMIILLLTIFSAIALVISVISLVLSIIVSSKYKKAQREYIWGAANR